MSEAVPRSVESPQAVEAAIGSRANVLRSPSSIGAASWCYDRVKSSTSRVLVVASFFGRSDFERNSEFQKLVDLLKADSLIMSAHLETDWNRSTVTFRNGTVIRFDA